MADENPITKNEPNKDLRVLEAVLSIIVFVSVVAVILGHTLFLKELESSAHNFLIYADILLTVIVVFYAIVNLQKTLKSSNQDNKTRRAAIWRFIFLIFLIAGLWFKLSHLRS